MTHKEQPRNWGIFALPMVLCAFVFVRFTLWNTPGISTTLFALLLVCTCLCYWRTMGAKPTHASFGPLALIVLLALGFSLHENEQISAPLLLMLLVLLPYWMLSARNARRKPTIGRYVLHDMLRASLTLPWAGLRSTGKQLQSDQKSGITIRNVLYALLFSIPLLLIVGALLLSADSEFERIAGGIVDALDQDLFRQAYISLLGGLYLLFMLRGISGTKSEMPPENAKRGLLPVASAATVLVLLCAVYLFFCTVQCMNIARIASGRARHSAFFYSQYAREGFFELCAIAVINLGVFVGIQAFLRDERRAIRILQTLLGAVTLLLILTACFKMGLYIHAYGFTLLRLHTMWFMAVLFLVFCLLIARQWIIFPAVRWTFAVSFVLFAAMGLANTGGIVAQANISMFQSGALQTLDLSQYNHFPYAAAPHLLALYEEADDPALREGIEAFAARWTPKQPTPFLQQNVQRLRSEALLTHFSYVTTE